jgi:ABC-type glycerol-3-phosphate transport system permease component
MAGIERAGGSGRPAKWTTRPYHFPPAQPVPPTLPPPLRGGGNERGGNERRGKERRGNRWRRRLVRAPLHLGLLVGAALWVYPFAWAVGSSFKTVPEFIDSGLAIIPRQLRWQNYADAWDKANFSGYFVNTMVITTCTVVLTMLLTSMAGYAFARTSFPGKRLLMAVIVVTFFLPRGYTIVPVYDLIHRLGLSDTLWAVILVETAHGMVFNTVLFMGYFSTVGRDLEEAARVDGASFHQVFWRIMLPLSRPMLATLGLFTFMSSWNDFLTPLVFTLGDPSLRTLPVGLYAFVSQTSTQWTLLAAGSIISLAPIMLVFVFAQRYIVDAVAGAVKG